MIYYSIVKSEKTGFYTIRAWKLNNIGSTIEVGSFPTRNIPAKTVKENLIPIFGDEENKKIR
jgi:hypothetical protein